MAKKYDQLAYDFIKISLTAYSLTAILGGILIFHLPDFVSCLFRISIQYFPSSDAYLCLIVRGREWNALYLLLWLGQNERRVHEVDPSQHVGHSQCDWYGLDVPGQFLDRFHDVSCGSG